MADISKGFEATSFVVDDAVGIIRGTDPAVLGEAAPKGSILLDDANGKLWIKTGPADTEWAELSSSTSSEMAGITVGLTTQQTINTAWGNIVWDNTFFQNDTNIIEHSAIAQDRILIKETGVYLVACSISFDADIGEEQISIQCLTNDTVQIPGSLRVASEADEIDDLSNVFLTTLNAGDYVTCQIMASGTGNVLHSSSTFTILRAKGQQGPQGPAGSGSSLTIQDEAASVPNTPHSTLNFTGDAVTVTDAGNGIATVNINTAATIATAHASVLALRTTDYTITNAFTDISFDTTPVENQPNVIIHDAANTPTTVTVLEDGLYAIYYGFNIQSQNTTTRTDAQVVLNGNTVVPGSGSFVNVYQQEIHHCSQMCVAQLAANDSLTVQLKHGGNPVLSLANSVFLVYKLEGQKGPKGDPGAAEIIIRDEGPLIPNTPHSELNFTGAGVTVTDAGGGIANIDIPGATANTYEVFQRFNGNVTQTFTQSFIPINLGTNIRTDANYSFIAATNTCVVNATGWYKITYAVSANATSNTRSSLTTVVRNNGVDIPQSVSYSYHRNNTRGYDTAANSFWVQLSAGDQIQLLSREIGGNVQTLANGCNLMIEYFG